MIICGWMRVRVEMDGKIFRVTENKLHQPRSRNSIRATRWRQSVRRPSDNRATAVDSGWFINSTAVTMPNRG